MEYIVSTVVMFLFAMLITQIILFEMTRNKAKKQNNVIWYLSLDKPFHYNRFKMMTYIVAFVYIFVGDNKSIFTLQGLLYFLLLLAMVIVSDMTCHYLMIKYGKVVCKKEIALAKELKAEVEAFEQNVYEDERHICVYFDALKKLYIIKKDTKKILNEVVLCDHFIDESIAFEDVCCIGEMIENYKYNECLDYLLNKKLISEKTYKKVMKKYK